MADQPAFAVSIDDARVVKMLTALPGNLGARVRQLIEGAAIDVQREMRIAAPIAVTGQLRGSIRYTFSPTNLRAEVMPEAPYAADVEYGTPPHKVSAAPGSSLRAWAEQKGLNPYAVQHAIALRGTKKNPFVEPIYQRMKPTIESDIAAGISALVQEANDGRI